MINKIIDGVLIIDSTHIGVRNSDGQWELYEAGYGNIPGVVAHTGNFLQGNEQHSPAQGEIWIRYEMYRGYDYACQSSLAPSYGPAWNGYPYIPKPSEVRAYAVTGEMRQRNWCF